MKKNNIKIISWILAFSFAGLSFLEAKIFEDDDPGPIVLSGNNYNYLSSPIGVWGYFVSMRNYTVKPDLTSCANVKNECCGMATTEVAFFTASELPGKIEIGSWPLFDNNTIKCCGCREAWIDFKSRITAHENKHKEICDTWYENNAWKIVDQRADGMSMILKGIEYKKYSFSSESARSAAKDAFDNEAAIGVVEIHNAYKQKQEDFHATAAGKDTLGIIVCPCSRPGGDDIELHTDSCKATGGKCLK